jgi:tetratricopeptide (TPR) repeat protein
MSKTSPLWLLALLVTVFFTLATSLELRVGKWTDPARAGGAFTKLLGDGRKLFANQFIEMADVYLHSGVYPSIFDRRDTKNSKAISAGSGDHADHDEHDQEAHQHDDEHEKVMNFRPEPRNWLDQFIRRFRITAHTELEGAQAREVLPWLRVAIELDPQKTETYVTTAYWLRKQIGRVKEAEQVLREGIRNNPESAEILYEMGLLYQEGYHDTVRARNLWTLALRRWSAQTDEAKASSTDILGKIAIHFARLEEAAGNLRQAIPYFEMARQVSPDPEPLQKHIAELKAKLGDSSSVPLKPVP